MNDTLITLISIGLYLGALGLATWWVYRNRPGRDAPTGQQNGKICCSEARGRPNQGNT